MFANEWALYHHDIAIIIGAGSTSMSALVKHWQWHSETFFYAGSALRENVQRIKRLFSVLVTLSRLVLIPIITSTVPDIIREVSVEFWNCRGILEIMEIQLI